MASLLAKWKLALMISAHPDLTGADFKVAMQLLDQDRNDEGSWRGHDWLATQTGQTERNVIRCTDRLVAAGYFTVEKSRGRGHANTYRPVFGETQKVTARSPILRSEKVTRPSPITRLEKVTAPSLFPEEKVTPVSVKGDAGVQEKVTPVPPHSSYKNPLKESAEERELSPAERDDGFDEFWRQFPAQRRAAREKCRTKYRAIVKSRRATPEQILGAVLRYSASDDVACGFACAPHRWLNEERWQLEPTPAGGARPNSRSAVRATIDDLLADDDRDGAFR